MAAAQVALRDRMCPSHPSVLAKFVCEDCDNSLACVNCVTSKHQGHTLKNISDVLEGKRQKIQDRIETVQNEVIPGLNSKLASATKRRTDKKQSADEQRASIRLRSQKLKEEVDRQTEELLYECNLIEKGNEDCQDSYEKKIRKTADSYRLYAKQLSDVKNTSNAQALDQACEKMPSISVPRVPRLKTFTFNPSTSALDESIKSCLGSISKQNDLIDSEVEDDLTELSSFKHSSGITTLRCMDNDVWISYAESKIISCMSDSGSLKEKVKTTVSVDSFCAFPSTNGKLWMCSVDDSSISIIANKEQAFQFRIPGQPLSISVENPDTILIGFRRCVAAYDAKGQEKFSTDNPKKANPDQGYFKKVKDLLFRSPSVEEVPKKQQMVTWPRNICQDKTSGDVAIVDWDSTSYSGKGKPHIVVTNRNLSLQFTYYGTEDWTASGSSVTSTDFKPFDVCYNNKGNILVADYSSSSIQLIDGRDGHFLQTLMWTDSSPKSLSLLNDCLWVGLENRNVKVLKYCS